MKDEELNTIHVSESIGIGGVFEGVENEKEFVIRVYRVTPGAAKDKYCGIHYNEELDEDKIGRAYGVGDFKCVLHVPSTRKNYTRIVPIDPSFLNSLKGGEVVSAGSVPHGSGTISLTDLKSILDTIKPFILDKPVDPFDAQSKAMAQLQKMQEQIIKDTIAQRNLITQEATLKPQGEEVEDADDVEEAEEVGLAELGGWSGPMLFEMIKPFIAPLLAGLIPKSKVDKQIDKIGLREELEAKGELYQSLVETFKAELGEEKAEKLIKKAFS